MMPRSSTRGGGPDLEGGRWSVREELEDLFSKDMTPQFWDWVLLLHGDDTG